MSHRALAAFRISSYRYQWPADLLTSWAFEMETLILGWYVLVQTESVLLLSLFAALQFGGTLLSPYIGTLSDRVGRRRLLLMLRSAYATAALVLATLDLTGVLAPWHVFAIGVVVGLVRPSDLVMRNALIGDTVPESDLSNAMGLSRTTMDSARIAGALVGAGLIATIGFGASYLVVSVFYLGSLVLTRKVAAGTIRPATASAWTDLKSGLRFVIDTPQVGALMWLAFLVNLAAFPISHGLLPYVAREIYGTDATGLGWLMAAFAVGALSGSVALAWTGGTRHATRTVVTFIVMWFGLLVGFAHVDTLAVGLAIMVLIGLCQSMSMISMSVALLVATDASLRGRIMGVRMLAVYGLPVGLVIGGALIEYVGFTWQATIYALVGLAVTAGIALRWREALWRR